MNKIFKVIWSKSKQCYIVVSEIAKNKTGKKKIVVAGIFAALAMVNGGQATFAAWPAGGEGAQSAFWMGRSSSATGQNAQAIGVAANASSAKSVAIGSDSFAQGYALGNNVTGATAVGGHASAIGTGAVALGYRTHGDTVYATAIGSDSSVTGQYGVGLGWKANVSADNSIAVGEQSKAVKEGSTVMGPAARGYGNGSLSIGYQALAGANVYTGAANDASPYNDTPATINNYAQWGDAAIGLRAVATGGNATALGRSARAAAANAIAIGGGNGSDANNNTEKTEATGEKSTAIGYNAKAVNGNDTAIGAGVTANGGASTMIGYNSTVTGNQAFGGGSGLSVAGGGSVGLGYNSSTTSDKSIAIGHTTKSNGSGSIAIGANASSTDDNSVAIGSSNTTAYRGGVALGRNAKAENTAINNVAVGIDVTAGANTNGKSDGEAVAVGRNAKANSFRTVAIGSDVSATGSTAVAMGRSATVSNNYGVAVGARVEAGNYGVALGYQAKSTASGALAIGAGNDDTKGMATATTASGGNSVAIGASAKASTANSVALGSNSTTDKDATEQKSATINSITYNFAGATSDKGMQVSVGAAGKERQIKNVAAGEVSATSTDAVNGSQLFAVASQIKPINYFSVKSSAVGNKNNAGATGTDAIAIGPGAQSSGDNGVSLGNGSQANAESVVSIGYQSNYGAQNNSKSIGIGWAAGFQSKGTENIGIGTDAGRKLTGSNNVSIGKSAGLGDVYSSGSVLLGQSATIVNSTDKAAINDVVAIGNGAQGGAASSVAIGKGAKALGFSTIAIGENSNAKVKVGSAPSVAIGRNTTANGDYAVALGGGDNSGQFQGAKAAGVGTTAVGSATVTKDDTNFQTAVGFGAKTDATNASAFGYNASATANNATALGYGASATAENATALGTGAIAKIKDGVAIGSGSKTTVDKGVKGYDPNDGRTNKYGGLTNNILTSTNAAVSVGEGASVTRQITGVAAGTSNTDAVNVAQLKSVNLAFSGNSGNNDVNLANGTLAIKGDTTYITTTANTNGITIAGKKQDISVNTNGVASASKGMADAQNVAQSINDAISKNAYTWTVSANGDAGESVAKGNKVDFNGDSSNITVERAGKKITTKLNKDITVDSVKANNKVTVGTAAKQLVLDGTTGAMTAGIGANAIKLDGTSATITAGSGNNAISLNGTNAQAAFGSGTNAVSINGKTGAVTGQTFTAGNTTINTTGLTSGTGSSAVSFGTNGISAGNQTIKNVSTGGSTDSNAANIGDVKRYVSGATLNLTDGANNKGSVQLGDQSLKVTAGTGLRATVDKQSLNIALTPDAQNAISSGIGLAANSGSTGIKHLKDGNITFDIKGDGSVVKTTASTSGVTIAVDTDKLAANTNLAYTANGASTAKNVALSKGLNFVNGSNTIAIVNDDGKVSFDLNATTKNQINTNTTGVADNKASIATNTSDIATNKNKIATNTTDIAANKSKIATNTTNIAANTTAIARNISLGADSGAKSSQSLSTGDVAFNIKGATGDFISTKMNGNTVEVSTKRAQIDSDANNGTASVTGDDGLATTKNVADAINNAVTKSAYEWKLSANSEANPTTVGKGDIVDFTGGSNITVDRDNKNISVKLNKNLTNLSSVSIGNNIGETIKLDGSNGGITADHADFKDNTGAGTSIDSSGIRINNGIADLTHIGMGSISLDNGSGGNTVVTSSSVSLTDGSNLSEYNAKGIAFGDTTGTNTAQFGLEGISAANQQIKDVAAGTDDTDAVNVKQLKDTVGDQKLSISDGTKDSTVALKNQKLTVTGTGAAKATVNGQTITIDVAKGTLTANANGTATGTAGVADASDVASAINNTNTVLGGKIAKNAQDIATNTSNITANKNQITTNTTNIATNTANIAHTIALADDNGTSTTAKSLKDGNVSFNIKGDNKFISTAASGNDVTLTVNEQAIKDAAKSASSFKVKANTHAEEEVKGGDTIAFNNGDNIEISQNGKTFTIGTVKNITVDSVTAGNTVINTSGLTNGTTAITGTGITTDKVTVGGLSIDKTAGINAGGKVISNVASGTVNDNATDDSNAANIGDVKQAVANLSQNLNITDGTNNGTVDLKNQKLNVAGANGVTATVNNQTITVGLDANTVNATTKGIGLTADTGSTGNKYLKDGDVSFAVTGDGNLVSTSATAAGVKVAVDAAKVKDLAVSAVTVSKDTQADNPITVTTTAGTNSKDYAIGIDTTKLAAKTDLTYRANSAADANAKKISLSKGLNFVDGGSTVATVDNDGKVSFDLNTATKTQINTNTTDIATNKGNIATNTADIATNKGKIATNTTNIAANTTALARNISLGADTGTASSQSLSTADVAFNVKGATGDFVSTNMNGNTVEISTKRATINSNATTGEASVTGNDGLATAKNVSDAINKAAEAAKAGAAWNITTNSSTTDKTAVKGGDTVDFINGNNIEITQDGTDKKKITVATKKDITVDSVTANNKVTVGSGANKITLDGTDGSVTGKAFTGTTFTGTSFTGTSFTAGNTVINTNGLTNGTTAITGTGVTTDNVTVGGISIDKTAGINAGNKVISNVASGGTTATNAANIGDVQNAVANLSQNLNITDGTHNGTVDLKNQKLNVAGTNGVTATVNNQTITVGLDADTVNATTKGIGLTADTGSTGNKYLKDGDVSFAVTGDGSLVSTSATAAGVKVAVNSASITAGTDGTITGPTTDGVATAKNVADAINAAKKASKTEITANTGEAANATTGNVTLTSTTAADGHTIYDVKLNDKVTLGSGANTVTIDGTTGAITGKTATIGGVTVNGTANTIGGLSNTTWNGTAVSGRAATEDQLKAATGATTLKFTGDVATNTGSVNLKDDTFGIKGDGKYISTDVNGKNVNLTVSEAEVKKSAVAAVTVSTDTTDANNPLTVTPTTSADGTTKDYKVTIDGTKIANKTNLSYKANDGTAKQVSLADGLNFKNGTLTTASIDDKGVVKYDVNTASITAGTDGTITGPATDGVATAKNVADAINAAKKASKTEITANTGEAANATTGNVTLTSTTAADGHTIYDVKLNDKVTLGTGANAVTVDGTAAKVTAGVTTVDGATGTITTGGTNSIKVDGATGTVTGLTNKDWTPGVTKAVTGRAATEDQLQKVADAASSQTWNITADKAGTTGAQTGTKKNATVGKDETVELVAGDNLTINQDERKFTYSLNKDLANLTSVSVGTGTTETIKLDGATGKITAKNASIGGVTIDGDNNHVTGLANTTWNGTATSGRAATEDQLKAVADTAKTTTDAVNLKFSGNTNTSPGVVNLKDDTFGIVGDGKYVSTDANGKNLTVKVSEAEVKKSAVAAVTVSTDTTDANNPLTVTPTTSADGTTKDYKVTIDGTKIANKTNLSYKANDGTAKQVSLADGLNFKNGTLTTASIDDAGVVKYDVNTASITAGADGTITGPTTDGVATAQNVADAINAAKKASKTEITANTGEAANATTGNVILTSTTAADGHTIYDVKLNDKVTLGSGANAVTIDGTAGKATIGSSIVDGVNNTFTTGGASPVTLNGATGTITGKTANIGGVTVNGTANTIGGLSNTTWNGTATTGRAATEDQLKVVADAAGSQTWEITADKDAATSGAQTGTKKNAKVGKDDKVQLIAGENLTVNQNERDFTYSLNKDLVKMNSATFEATGGKTTVIKGDSIVQTDGANVNTSNATSNTITDGTNTSTITAGKAQIGTVGIDGVASKISTGGTNAVVVNGADGTIKTGTVTVIGGTTNDITGLSNTTLTATDFATKGRAATEEQLKAATGATTLKFTGDVATNTGSVNLKDDTFGIKGDGKYISTDVNGKNVNLTVSEAEVKKSAVAAVTVSTDTTDANNPLTVTPTTSADGSTKDYKVTIDGTKIANKTNLSYKANDGTAKQVSLADGLNFKNGTLTTASIDDNGVVKYDVNTASITAGTDGTITGPTTDGVATAKNVADAINAAKKASKTEITANTGEATNATTGNVTLTSTTAADGHTIYDVKLNDKVTLGSGANAVTIDGTAGKATIGSSIVDGVNNTFTTGGASPVTLNGATGTITGKTANIGGVTVNGTANTIGGLSNTTWNGTATTGRAATEDQLKAVADAAGSQTWEITADKKAGTSGAQTGTKENAKVGKDDKVSLIAGENLTVDQAGKNFTYSLNKDLLKMNSATFEVTGGKTTVIKGDSIVQTDGNQTNTATASGNTVANGTKSTETTADGQVIKDGAKSNKSTVDNNVIDDGNGNVNTSNATSNTITDGTNTSTITAGKAQIGTVGIDGVASKITTGGANAVKLDGVAGTIKTGTVTVTGGTTNDITGLSNTTLSATDFATKGRAATEEQLKAATGATTLKFTGDVATNTGSVNLKDDTFGIKGDGKYISTDVNGKNVNLTVSEAEVKKSAVAAVTVSTDTTDANNPLTVTPTTSADGTTKDYKVTIDGTKIANKTNLSYKANGGTAKQVSLADGLNFKNGTLTTASIDDAGVVKYDVNTASITAGADGTITGPTTDGVATAQNVAVAINAAKKASKTEITANTGEAANATTGNVTLTSTTAADGHTIYDVKLNDKVTLGSGANAVTIDGTAGKATIGSSIVDGVNNTFTTGGASSVTLNGATGTITGKTANIGGVTVDGTNNHVMGLANKDWTPGVTQAVSGRAATEDQLQKVSDAVGAGWKVNTGKVTGSTGESNGATPTKVASGEEVQFQAGNNLIVDQNGKTVAYSLNKALKDLESATFNGTGTNKTVITGDSITQTAGTQTNTSTAGGNTVADGTKSTETTAAGQVIKDGAKSNKSTVDNNVIDDGNGNVNTSNATSNTVTDGTNTTATTSSSVTVKDNAGNSTVITKDNVTTGVGANKVTLDGTAGKATIGSSVIDGVNNTFTTGGANAVKLDGAAGTIKTGTVTVTGGTTNDITGLSNTTVTAADFATKGRAATEEQLKAVGEQTWQITADKDATTSGAQTGTKKNAKVGKDDKVQLIAGENLTVNQNERDFTYSLNKDLVKMNSATFEATGGRTTVIKGDSIVQTDGTKVNTSTAGGSTVADGTKSTETTADGQVIKDGAKSNKSTVDSNVIDDGNGNVNTSNATSNTITDGTNTSTVTAGKAQIGTVGIDGVASKITTGGANAVVINGADGTVKTGTVTVTGGTTNDITGLSNTTVTTADFATKGRAATEEQLKAVGEQTWQITADKDATTSGVQTGTKKDAKVGKDDKVQLIAGENLTVNQNERDFTYSLNKDLVKMNSATFEATGGKTTVIKGDSIVQTDGRKVNTSTAAGNTVVDGAKSTATTADGTTVTTANGNTNYAADGVRINTTGKTPVSLTDAGLDNGNNVIKNVASGHVNNDATDNTNAANIADVKKATTTVTANAGEAANATTGNVTLTSTTAADGHTIYDVKLNDKVTLGSGANAVTIDGTAGKATIGSSVMDGVNNIFTTGGANAVKLDGVAGTIKTGTVTVTGGTTNDITGLSNTTVTAADFATKGRAATEEQLKAVGEQTWQITADKDATTSGAQTGTKKNAKVGKDDKVQLIAGENLTVNQNERDFTYSLNKDLVKMNSATFEATGGRTTVIKGDSIVQTDGTKVNTSTAGGNTVADGTKSTETTAAGQVIKDGAKSNKSTVDNNVIDDGNGNVNTSNATSNTITDGTNTSAITAGKATIGSSVIDGVNNTFTTGGANAVKLDGAAGTIKTGTVTVTGGTTNDITGLSNTTVTAADFATKGRAATEEQLKAVGEQTWQITADKDATTSGAQTGTKKDAKVGKDDKVQLIAGENMTVNQNERDFTFTLNKDLVKMNSATFLGTGSNTTVITGNSITQIAGTQTNTSTAAGNTVADGTKSTETTAAGQVIKDGAKSNKSTVDNNVIDDGNGNVNTSNATSNTITDGTNTSAITAGKATIGSSVIDGVNNTFTTGGANAVKLDGAAGTIKTGTVTVTGGTTNDITGLSNTTVTAADFATKGRAATEEQLKAVGEQTWQITADKDATTSGAQTGTKKDAKVGKNDKVQLIAGENMTVNQNERDFTFTLNKDLVKMNSATFLGTGSNKTVITGDSITQTAGTQTNTSTAGGNTVADGTKSTETTAAGQVIKDGTKTNTSTVDENTIVDGTKSNKSTVDGNTITDGTNTTETTSSSVTVKDNAGNSTVITKDNITTGVGANKVTLDGTAGKATIGSSIVDGVNNTFTTGGANAVKLDGVTGTIKTGTVTVTGGTTNDITGLSNTTVTAADFATKGRAATEEQLKAVGEQTWQITADKDATTSGAQTGTKKDAKVGKDDKVQLIAGENMTVNQNERDFTFTLNKDLVKMNSATFLGTGTNKTVITGDSITQTAGTQTNTSTAGGNTVADGTKSTETTADGQVIKDGAKTNTSTVDENTIVDGTKSNKSTVDGNTITDGTNTTETTSSSVTVKDNAGNSTVITKDNITTGVGANKVTLDGTAGKATVGASVVDGVNNTFTTGGANAVKLDGAAGTIKTGTVTVTGGTTNDITGLSNTTVTAADFATKGRAATEEQLKAVGEQTWQITADKDATTSGAQTGTKKDAKVGKNDKVQLIAGENMTVNQNERDFTFTLNKDLVKMNSATFLGTGSNTTVITGNSITQTAGTQTNTSTAGGNTVADGTKSTETTAAGQVIKDGAKSNKSTVDSNVIDDGNGNVNTSNATSNTITDGTNTSTITAGKANIGNIAVDGVNNKITMGNGATPVTLDGANGHLDGLTNTTWVPGVTKATTGRAATEDQLQQVSDAVGAGWKVNTGTVAGSSGVSNGAASTKVSSGEEVKLQAGDNLVIDQNGKTVSYSLNKDLTKMNSATFEATGGKTTVIKGDSIVQIDGGKTNTSNAAGNTVVDGNKSTSTTAAGTTITDGAKTNTSTTDKNVINDGAGNTNTATATSNNLADNAGNSNVSNATSNTLKNAAGDETKADAKGVTVKDAAGNNATFTKDGITITKTGKDTVSLTSDGLDNGKNKIVNVAAGVANTDAVNVGQLKEYAAKSTTELTANNGETAGSTTGNIVLTKTTAADGHTIYDNKLNDKITLGTDPTKAVAVDGTTGTVTGLTNKTWTPGSIVSGRAATEDQLKEAVADSGWKAAVDKEGSGQSTVVGTSPEKIKAEETVTFKAGNNMMVTQTGKSISYAVNPELTNMTSATFKDAAGNTMVTNGNGITITPGSANPTNPHAGPVSLTKDGLNNGNNQIKGVAPGTDPTDAVNVSQLNASNANTSQAINQIAGEVQHVGAHAAAMAALKPIQYDPLEPTQVMAGVGNYRGETAAALGLAHYTNENTMFNVGVSVGGNHNMVNAGVTHKFGYSPEKKNIPDRYKAGPISSVYVMQDEVSSLKKENAEQKYVIADQAARLTTLEAENEQQRRELAETKKGLDDLKAAVDKLLASKG